MAGIEVVEMGVWVADPAAGCVLADGGAEVFEVEPTSVGDPARRLCRAPVHPGWQQDPRFVRPRPRTASTPTQFSQRSAIRLG